MPWQPTADGSDAAETVKVEDMMLQVDTMLENTEADDDKVKYASVILPENTAGRGETCAVIFLLLAFVLVGPQKPHQTHAGVHDVSRPEAVRRDISQRGLPTHERGLHQAGRDDQRHEEPQRHSEPR